MTDNLNNLFGSNFSSDDIIDKKRLEKNIDNISDKNDTQEDESSVGGRILSGIMFLAIVIFSIIFTVLITSNLSFLITCGGSLTAIGKDGKKRTFNDIWFPSYYFYQENKEAYPFCQGLKLNQNGFFNGFKFSSGLPWEKYSFDFLSWITRLEMGVISDFVNYLMAVSKKTNIINNARIIDLLQIIEFIMPNDPFYRNLILLIIGIPLIFGIIILSGFSSTFVYIYNLLTTDFPTNLIYLSFLSFMMLLIVNFFFPFIFLIPFEIFFFPITTIVYTWLLPVSFVILLFIFAFYNSLVFNVVTLFKLMFVGYLAGGYKAISKNAQENKKMYMFFVGLTLLLSIIFIVI
jgi:hypothetical protein